MLWLLTVLGETAACPGLFAALFPPGAPSASAPEAAAYSAPSYAAPAFSMPSFASYSPAQVSFASLSQSQSSFPAFQTNFQAQQAPLQQLTQSQPNFQAQQMPLQQLAQSQVLQEANMQQPLLQPSNLPSAQFQMQLPEILPLPSIAPPLPLFSATPAPQIPTATVANVLQDPCYEEVPNVGNGNCFINTSGYFCCDHALNSFIEQTANQHLDDARWKGCNAQRMAVDFENYAHERFQMQFETIIGSGNFCHKNHWTGDMMCKSRLSDGKVIMVYANPTTNNFGMTSGLNGTSYVLPSFGL